MAIFASSLIKTSKGVDVTGKESKTTLRGTAHIMKVSLMEETQPLVWFLAKLLRSLSSYAK
jgi:hypothetical protein